MTVNLPIPIVAAIVSAVVSSIVAFFTIRITKKNIKKQIRVSKLEEILEILVYFQSYYKSLFWLVIDTDNTIKHQSQKPSKIVLEEHNKKVEAFKEHIGESTLFFKFARLTVLVNAYIPNTAKGKKLKAKIIVLGDMVLDMYTIILRNDTTSSALGYTDGFPKPINFKKHFLQIEDELIKEMDLGYSSITPEDIRAYKEHQFKKDLKIID